MGFQAAAHSRQFGRVLPVPGIRHEHPTLPYALLQIGMRLRLGSIRTIAAPQHQRYQAVAIAPMDRILAKITVFVIIEEIEWVSVRRVRKIPFIEVTPMSSRAATATNSAPADTGFLYLFERVTVLEAQAIDPLVQTERQRMTPGLPDPGGR